MANLTAKQQRFCDEYLIDLNATQAAIRAGYSRKTAYSIGEENLKKPELKKYIEQRMAEKEDALIAKQDEVLKFLTAVMRGNAKDEKPMVNAMGEIEMIPVLQQSNQLKAAEMLAKRYGLLIDKTESDIDMNLEIKIDYGAE